MITLRTLVARKLPPKVLRYVLPPRLILYGHVVSDSQQHPARRYYNFPTTTEFARLIQFLRDAGYRFVSLADYINTPNHGDCLLTFDDGFREVYSIVHPFLSNHDIPYAIFICGGSVTSPCRIRHFATTDPEFLTLGEIKHLKNQGVHIGFHGNYHELMSANWTDEAVLDLARPPEAIAKLLSAPRTFAYPFRAPDDCDRTDVLIRSAGFDYVFGTIEIKPDSSHFSRISMDAPPGNPKTTNTALYGIHGFAFSRINIRRILSRPRTNKYRSLSTSSAI
jgi:peptidoglycan/xylan/chitin deacetylase (PgdA/CDA1 family)